MNEQGLSALEALREAGAQNFDPVRFRYIEVLSRRIQTQPDAVRCILEGKLKVALSDYAERFERRQTAAGTQTPSLATKHTQDAKGLRNPTNRSAPEQPRTPLNQLNLRFAQVKHKDNHAGMGSALGTRDEAASEMKSVRRFRDAWSRMSAQQQVTQAVGLGPDQAGPLNSHMLVLRSLELMRSLSPDYLRRFLSHVDSLQWLDLANTQYQTKAAKPKSTRQRSQKR